MLPVRKWVSSTVWRMVSLRNGGCYDVRIMRLAWTLLAITLCCKAQNYQPEWPRIEDEVMRHFQAILRTDTQNPPGNELLAVEYLKKVLEAEGIAVKTFALEPDRPNLVARIKGSGKKRPY